MSYRLSVIGYGLWVSFLITGCLSSSDNTSFPSIGEVKISYFAIIKGAVSKQPQGSYMAIISKPWLKKYGRKLNEPFEKLRLHPGHIAIKSAQDKEIRELIDLIQKQGFYSLPPVNLARYTLAELERSDFTTQVITIEVNGSSYSVALEDLPRDKDKIDTFLKVLNTFYAGFLVIEDPFMDVQVEDLREMLRRQLPPPETTPKR